MTPRELSEQGRHLIRLGMLLEKLNEQHHKAIDAKYYADAIVLGRDLGFLTIDGTLDKITLSLVPQVKP